MKYFLLLFLLFPILDAIAEEPKELLRVGVVGLTHDHVHAVLGRHKNRELKIVGIAESNRELASRFSKRYGFAMDLVHDSLDEMLDEAKPDVVSDYGSTFGHLKTVEASAPRGIHVMVEKPLAVNLDHARTMQRLADRHSIQLLTNYETTWYPSHHDAKTLLQDKSYGDIRKMVVHDGHRGPKEIGCSKEFLEWLTDPDQNGGGALMDFGCYGANLATWLMEGERPVTVTAVTQQIKPETYPHVEDEATIILAYNKAQAIIQASWNWNYSRKDIEIYCTNGSVHCLNASKMSVRTGDSGAEAKTAATLPAAVSDPYKYFASVVRGEIQVKPTDLSALENNMVVMEILDAAKRSAAENRTIRLN
ncbi:MAG: Gfo/Idh/MocA family oxidoreductase [Planctomycetota bacterium]